MPHTVREGAAPRRAWEVVRGAATAGLLAWLFLELWLFAGAAKGSDVFAARLGRVGAGPSAGFVVCLAAHVVASSILFVRGRGDGLAPSRWVRLADRASMVAVWVFAATHYTLFWRGAAEAWSPFDAWVRALGATPAGVPLVAFGYLLGLGACAYATARVVIVAERRGSRLAAVLGVALGAVVLAVGTNGVVAIATGAGTQPLAPTTADPCGTP